MSIKWNEVPEIEPAKIALTGYLVFFLRSAILTFILILGLLILAIFHGIDRLLGTYLHAWPAHAVTKVFLRIIGLSVRFHGERAKQARLFVSNHVSWLDIMVLNASVKAQFISKDEVKSWPGMGPLSRVTGTVFISRERLAAKRQLLELSKAISRGKRLILFPEGTTTDGRHLAPFRSSMLQMCYDEAWDPTWLIQPVSLVYHGPPKCAETFYGWWGEMELAPSLLGVIGKWRQGHVDIYFHPPTRAQSHLGRKELTVEIEKKISSPVELGPSDQR